MMETREITVTIHREPEKRDDLLGQWRRLRDALAELGVE